MTDLQFSKLQEYLDAMHTELVGINRRLSDHGELHKMISEEIDSISMDVTNIMNAQK
jgi:hypothetical protein